MDNNRILYVCQEITPYLPENEMSLLSRKLPQAIQEKGMEIRTFMPRFGAINERRNQLHEVIRLSGMNLIIDDNDHQLIIKVASIPSARVQIYFIDNDEYFQRKTIVFDEQRDLLSDNDERSIFFARGVLETVKKLRWSPNLVHCIGWFTAVVPIYLKRMFADDPIFSNVKVVVSLYGDGFKGSLDNNMRAKIESEGVSDAELALLDNPTYENLMKFVIKYSDGIVYAGENIAPELVSFIEAEGKPVLVCDKQSDDYAERYYEFYKQILQA